MSEIREKMAKIFWDFDDKPYLDESHFGQADKILSIPELAEGLEAVGRDQEWIDWLAQHTSTGTGIIVLGVDDLKKRMKSLGYKIKKAG